MSSKRFFGVAKKFGEMSQQNKVRSEFDIVPSQDASCVDQKLISLVSKEKSLSAHRRLARD